MQMYAVLAVDVINVKDKFQQSDVHGCQCQHFTKGPVHVHLLFTFLEIHQRTRRKASVPGTGVPSDAGAVSGVVNHISIQLCPMSVACWCLDSIQFLKIYCIRVADGFGFLSSLEMNFVMGCVGHETLYAC